MRILVAGLAALALIVVASGACLAWGDDAAAPSWQRTPLVGLQVGHWQADRLPEELADLRTNGGAEWQGYRELDANFAVAASASEALRAAGVRVALLPATVPPHYA